ncbi:MAG: glycosyltransferase family 4 protein [Spirochaetales bacterium]|nr:glycosyltransferase family 4 protein [Spirochaetales bacterium]
MGENFRIAIICGKLGGVDGVSLEVDKWIFVLKELGHEIYTIAGKYDSPLQSIATENQMLVEEIAFDFPEQLYYEKIIFPFLTKTPASITKEQQDKIIGELLARGKTIAAHMFSIIQQNNIDLIIAENTNAMPMTLIGGIAVYELSKKRRVATIFHHHDFWWERSRFSNNNIESLLNEIMPPFDWGIDHVVLTSYAAHILRSLKRVEPKVIPNCEDFEHPVVRDEYNSSFRQDLGFKDDDLLIIQPTRIVKRKRIEDSILLLGAFKKKYPQYRDKIQFIISLYQGDEPDDNYISHINKMAEKMEIPLHLISGRVSSQRGRDKEGRKLYTNRDVLANADLVTYLPLWEGFGNALLEAIAAKAPLVTTTYLVYKTDIKVTGLRTIEIRDQYDEKGQLIITDKTLEDIKYIFDHEELRNEMIETNFQICKREFGYDTLKQKLKNLLQDYSPEIIASRRRLEKSKLNYSV